MSFRKSLELKSSDHPVEGFSWEWLGRLYSVENEGQGYVNNAYDPFRFILSFFRIMIHGKEKRKK
jgi:hypothetical protein